MKKLAIKMLILALPVVTLTACISVTDHNSQSINSITQQANQVCGAGNIESVNTSGFRCKK